MKVTLPAASQEDSSPAGQLLDFRNGNSGWELQSCSALLLPAPISSSAGCPGWHGWLFQHCWARGGAPAAWSQAAAARQQLLHSSDVAGQQQFGQRHSHVCKTCFQNTKHVEEFPFRIKPIVREKDRGHSVIVSRSISCLGSCCTPRQSLAKVPAARVEHSGHLQLPGPRAGTRCPSQAPMLQEAALPSRVLCAGRQRHQDPLFVLNCKLFNWKRTMGKNKCAQVDFHV